MPSRLTSPFGTLEAAPKRVAGHAARAFGTDVLISSDSGEWTFLSRADYARYLAGKVTDEEPLGDELASKGFLLDRLDFARLASFTVSKHLLDWPGPSVHSVEVTGARGPMTPATARQVVDLIFQTPNPEVMIEFVGGEPLANWPVLKFIVEYARLKNPAAGKTLRFAVISDFSLLDDAKRDWLVAHGVAFCASSLAALARMKGGAPMEVPNALITVDNKALPRWKEIIDQAVSLGLERVQLGPSDTVEPEAYVAFYAKALDYLIALSLKGVKAYEKMALILLIRILEGEHWRFPNAEGTARLSYGWDGAVYTGEDGRLLDAGGNPFFRIGHAADARLTQLLDHPAVKLSLRAALPQAQPMCSQCAYAPYCTVQPVANVATQHSPWGSMPENRWCRTIMGVFDVLFARLRDPKARPVLESWLEYRDR